MASGATQISCSTGCCSNFLRAILASRGALLLGEARFARGSHLEAAREFRKASDDSPNDPHRPRSAAAGGRCLCRSLAPSRAGPHLRADRAGDVPGADRTAILEPTPPSGRSSRINELNERFAYKAYKAALYYFRLKAYDSAILYLKDLVATYPKASVVPEALVKLVQAYRKLDYREDVQETCGYIRRFHPEAPGANEVCPTNAAGA